MKDILNQKNFRIIFLVLSVGIFVFYFFLSFMKPLYQDEGVFLAIGKQVFQGHIPYLDFWDHKTPGIYYLFASLYGFFGTKIIFYKLLVWLISLLTGFLVFSISQRLKSGSGYISAIFFLLALIFFEGNYLTAGPFLALFLAGTVWLILTDSKKFWPWFLAGTFLALAVLFKQTALINLGIVIVYLAYLKKIRNLFQLLVGFFLLVSILTAYLLRTGALFAFWQQAVIANFHYPAENFMNVLNQWLETSRRVWWLWFGFLAGLFFFKKIGSGKWLVFLFTLVPVFTFYVRPYPHYWLQVLPFLAILSGIGFFLLSEILFTLKLNYFAVSLYGLIIFSLISNLLWFNWVTEELNQPKQTEQERLVTEIDKLPGSKLLAENYYTGFYFLSDKEPLNRYLYLTEVNESDKARQKTIKDLANNHGITILWPSNQKYVYAKDVGIWIEKNSLKIKEYPALELTLYYRH